MESLKKLLKRVRSDYRIAMLLAIGIVVLGLTLLSKKADDEADGRKSAETLQFEKKPAQWLDHPKNVSELREALVAHSVAVVALDTAQPGLILYTFKNGNKASTTVPGCTAAGCAGTLLEQLNDKSAQAGFSLIRIEVDSRTRSRRVLDGINTVLSPILRLGLMVGAIFFAMKMQTGFGGAASKLTERPTTRFTDVVGQAEAKAALNRVKAFMHSPAQYLKLGAKAPRGVLLVGAPGTGKTLLARALAGESGANFIAVDGSYFTSMFYGAGVGKVRDLFKLARKNSPCVLFIDEVDGIGKRTRGGGQGGGESELNRIINRVLVEMDGFDALDNVVVVAATNHEDNIDEAMRRPGRFDMLVQLNLPILPERQALFDLYISKVAHDGGVDTAALARLTPGLSPADIANLVNKATSSAAEAGVDRVPAANFLRAIETHQMGGEVSAIKDFFTQDLRTRLAIHESGHALMGHWLGAVKVERVTIEPRGRALGVTYVTRLTEDPLSEDTELTRRLAMLLAGREAELLMIGGVSTGAKDDLKRATELAIEMVGSLGFSETFGLLSVAGVPKELLGPDIQAAVLKEARELLAQGQKTCQRLLFANQPRITAMAQRLLALEVLDGPELIDLLGPAQPLPLTLTA
jgi:cell division protease FtsH